MSWLVAGGLAANTSACGVSDESGLPQNVEDPTLVLTPRGAIGRYRGTVALVPDVVDKAVFWFNALPSDEVATAPAPIGAASAYTAADSRQDWATLNSAFLSVNQLRVQAREARGLLALYVPDSLPALRGHLAALEGYTELFLADAFCSGLPLSTVDVGSDYTLRASASTEEVYQHAKSLFDTALALTGDTLRFQQLAALGQGRALLGLGDYAAAAAAVAAIPDDYLYQVTALPIGSVNRPSWLQRGIDGNIGSDLAPYANLLTMGDRQGTNGLDFVSSGDPRTPAQALGQDGFGNTISYPANYPTTGALTHTLADGTEARLIEAEASLRANPGDGTWLAKLNALRTDGTFETQPTADPNDDPAALDTLWHAGRGRVAGLPVAGLAPLQDPGSDTARVSLVFRERAFWLYLTAHRLGDLRRLIRQYHRNPETVFPTGFYRGGTGVYGHEVVIPVPVDEQTYNPQYHGCIHRNA